MTSSEFGIQPVGERIVDQVRRHRAARAGRADSRRDSAATRRDSRRSRARRAAARRSPSSVCCALGADLALQVRRRSAVTRSLSSSVLSTSTRKTTCSCGHASAPQERPCRADQRHQEQRAGHPIPQGLARQLVAPSRDTGKRLARGAVRGVEIHRSTVGAFVDHTMDREIGPTIASSPSASLARAPPGSTRIALRRVAMARGRSVSRRTAEIEVGGDHLAPSRE